MVTQLLAETASEETLLLHHFQDVLKDYDTIIEFNGDRFDLPYLREKYESYGMGNPFDGMRTVDLYQELGSKYGDAVVVEASKGKPELTDDASEAPASEDQLISPAPANAEAPAEEANEPAHISEKTESRILEIVFIAMGALAAALIILARRKKRMK